MSALGSAALIAALGVAVYAAVAALIEGLHSSEAEIRFIAAYALGDVSVQHSDRVVPALSAAQQDADDAVRTAATLALQAFRTPTRYAGEAIIFEASTTTALQDQPPGPGDRPGLEAS